MVERARRPVPRFLAQSKTWYGRPGPYVLFDFLKRLFDGGTGQEARSTSFLARLTRRTWSKSYNLKELQSVCCCRDAGS